MVRRNCSGLGGVQGNGVFGRARVLKKLEVLPMASTSVSYESSRGGGTCWPDGSATGPTWIWRRSRSMPCNSPCANVEVAHVGQHQVGQAFLVDVSVPGGGFVQGGFQMWKGRLSTSVTRSRPWARPAGGQFEAAGAATHDDHAMREPVFGVCVMRQRYRVARRAWKRRRRRSVQVEAADEHRHPDRQGEQQHQA